DHFRRLVEGGLQRTDLSFDFAVFEDVAVHLRERGIAVDETAQQNDELEQVRVRLLPEGFFGFSEEIVDQCRNRKGDRIGVQVVVKRVVADVPLELDLRVV